MQVNIINIIEEDPKLNFTEVRKLQMQDPIMKRIIDFKERGTTGDIIADNNIRKDTDRYKMYKKVLLIRPNRRIARFKVWYPNSAIAWLGELVHRKFAHFGTKKILRILKEGIYCKNLARELRRTIARCKICQVTKYPNRSFQGAMEAIIPVEKCDLYAMDLFGPLPKVSRGNRFILVIIDVFSKFVQVYPVNKPSARNCLKKLDLFIELCGKPKRVLSDHGTQFTSNVWQEGIKRRGIQPILSSIRHPQSNPSERIMRELSRLFRAYCNDNHTGWIDLLPKINIWLNIIPHESTKVTPYYAHFHREYENIFKDLKVPESAGGIPFNPVSDRLIFENLKKSAEERIARNTGKTWKFKEGDKVWLKTPKPSDMKRRLFHKFFHIYSGPFTIESVPHVNVAKLRHENGDIVGQYNFYNLKPYVD